MISMQQWEQIRLRVLRDGEKIKVVARELGLAAKTVRKYVRSQAPPTKVILQRPRRLDAYCAVIDELLRSTPKITAKRVGSVLRERYDPELQISERALRQYVAHRRRITAPTAVFVRAYYAPETRLSSTSRRCRRLLRESRLPCKFS